MIRGFLIVLLCLGASPALAQTLPTSVDVLVLPATGDPATIAPVATRNTVIGTRNADGTVTPTAACNQPVSTALTSVVNPTTIAFTDPFNTNRDCLVPLPTGIPDGVGYRAVMIAVAPECRPDPNQPIVAPCPSARSAVGVPPFSWASVTLRPVVPTRLVVLP